MGQQVEKGMLQSNPFPGTLVWAQSLSTKGQDPKWVVYMKEKIEKSARCQCTMSVQKLVRLFFKQEKHFKN